MGEVEQRIRAADALMKTPSWAARAVRAERIVLKDRQRADMIRNELRVVEGVCGKNNCNCPQAKIAQDAMAHAIVWLQLIGEE